MIGVIFTHLLLTTPVIFKVLSAENSALFLRAIFPRYYLLLFVLSLLSLIGLYFHESQLTWWLGVNISGHALVGLTIIPLINAAKDRGWNKIFSFTHGASVYCTVVILLLSISQCILYLWSLLYSPLHHKKNLEHKTCLHCKKPFAWRKKWERSWDEVRFCSKSCKSDAKNPTQKVEVQTFTTILNSRG